MAAPSDPQNGLRINGMERLYPEERHERNLSHLMGELLFSNIKSKFEFELIEARCQYENLVSRKIFGNNLAPNSQPSQNSLDCPIRPHG